MYMHGDRDVANVRHIYMCVCVCVNLFIHRVVGTGGRWWVHIRIRIPGSGLAVGRVCYISLRVCTYGIGMVRDGWVLGLMQCVYVCVWRGYVHVRTGRKRKTISVEGSAGYI